MSNRDLQRDRRSTPLALTWEPWAIALGGVLILELFVVHLARAVANLFAGAGWHYTPGAELIESLPAVLTGHTGAGLPRLHHLASVSAFHVWLAILEVLTLVIVIAGAVWWFRRRSSVLGLATRSELVQKYGKQAALKRAKELRPDLPRRAVKPTDLAAFVGTSSDPGGVDIYVPADQTRGIIGPQGSGKSLAELNPVLLAWPGGAMVTLTKPEDMLLSITVRSEKGPCVVLDPFNLAPGLTEVVWDPIQGCEDAWDAGRRAKAFTAGTIMGSANEDAAARYYANEAAKVLTGWLHAAAIAGYSMKDVMIWAADPLNAGNEALTLLQRAEAAPHQAALVSSTLSGDMETVGNTISTLQSALGLFFQEEILRRCVPSPDRPATDVRSIVENGGTIYLLGREDPYASASPLMTAFAEHVLDVALEAANESPHGRLCPPFHTFLDEMPSTAPLPTLATHMSNDRALGLSYAWYAQAPAQLNVLFGHDGARAILGITNVLMVFAGMNDVAFAKDLVELLGTVRVARRTIATASLFGTNTSNDSLSPDDIPVLTVHEITRIEPGHTLVIPLRSKAFLMKMHLCITGKEGKKLRADQKRLREQIRARQKEIREAKKDKTNGPSTLQTQDDASRNLRDEQGAA